MRRAKPRRRRQTFTCHQHEIVTRPVHEAAQPRLYRCCVRRIADGDHWTRDSIGTELFQHADQLAKFARFRHHNSASAQLFRHAQTFIPRRYETVTRNFRDYADIR